MKFLGNACAITGSQNQNKQIEMQRRIQIITLDFFLYVKNKGTAIQKV